MHNRFLSKQESNYRQPMKKMSSKNAQLTCIQFKNAFEWLAVASFKYACRKTNWSDHWVILQRETQTNSPSYSGQRQLVKWTKRWRHMVNVTWLMRHLVNMTWSTRHVIEATKGQTVNDLTESLTKHVLEMHWYWQILSWTSNFKQESRLYTSWCST